MKDRILRVIAQRNRENDVTGRRLLDAMPYEDAPRDREIVAGEQLPEDDG